MNAKKVLVVSGLVVALGVPTGVAVAATTAPGLGPNGPATTQPYGPGTGTGTGTGTGNGGGYGHGPGFGRMGAVMGGGYGDPEDCPYYNSPEAQQLRDRLRDPTLTQAERQQLRDQLHDQMWQGRTTTQS